MKKILEEKIEMKEKTKREMKPDFKEKGITLTALVVAIIILLILATITIRAISGDNGIYI